MKRDRIILKQSFKKNVVVHKEDVMKDVKNSKEIHIIDQGKLKSGKEFVTVKIFV